MSSWSYLLVWIDEDDTAGTASSRQAGQLQRVRLMNTPSCNLFSGSIFPGVINSLLLLDWNLNRHTNDSREVDTRQ